jgi:hypothetical protein
VLAAVAAGYLLGGQSSGVTDAILGRSSLRGLPPSMSPPPRQPTLVNDTDMVSNPVYNTPCIDISDHCAAWKQSGECQSNPRFMMISCPLACGTCASTARAPPLPPLPERVAGHANLLEGEEPCKDESADCASWAALGECSNNKAYMLVNCPVSCRSCAQLQAACKRDEASKSIRSQPGGMDALFERALRDFPEYAPTVLHREPWVISFDNFIAEEDTQAFLGHCNASLVRSLAGDTVSPVRTSKQCWCSTAECMGDARVSEITERVANITGVPSVNMEYFQILRYEPGEFYKSHHDRMCSRASCARCRARGPCARRPRPSLRGCVSVPCPTIRLHRRVRRR